MRRHRAPAPNGRRARGAGSRGRTSAARGDAWIGAWPGCVAVLRDVAWIGGTGVARV